MFVELTVRLYAALSAGAFVELVAVRSVVAMVAGNFVALIVVTVAEYFVVLTVPKFVALVAAVPKAQQKGWPREQHSADSPHSQLPVGKPPYWHVHEEGRTTPIPMNSHQQPLYQEQPWPQRKAVTGSQIVLEQHCFAGFHCSGCRCWG